MNFLSIKPVCLTFFLLLVAQTVQLIKTARSLIKIRSTKNRVALKSNVIHYFEYIDCELPAGLWGSGLGGRWIFGSAGLERDLEGTGSSGGAEARVADKT